MSDIAIKVENLSKAYRLGQIGTGTISKDIHRWWKTKIRGQEDPFLKIGETNDRSVKGESDIVWSLKDINFEIKQGDAFGIIGRNGAGKSTLLKLLSRVTAPTIGDIKVKGRIASLLEVGTGFHPELTGRENIFLNGAILGMRKREIERKFDEIVDFSGVERYIDTPVKRYSSGMYVRLAFAVAAHLESEILIVDEVLAVGDAEFQKKCLGKMGNVSKGEGRTVLFVSHNMASVRALCDKAILMRNGKLEFEGTTNETLNRYLRADRIETTSLLERTDREGNGKVLVSKIQFKDKENNNIQKVFCGEYLKIEIYLFENEKQDYSKMIVACSFTDPNQRQIVSWISDEMPVIFKNEIQSKIILEIPQFNLRPSNYDFNIQISFGSTAMADITDVLIEAASINVVESNFFQTTKKLRSNHSALIPAEFNFY